jgi:hypothetical protein
VETSNWERKRRGFLSPQKGLAGKVQASVREGDFARYCA